MRNSIALFLLLTAFTFAGAQTPLPNGDLEAWTNAGSYEDPSGGWWATLNPLKSLGGPVTVTKSTDAHGGSYSAKLTTGSFGTLIVPGILISGEFDGGAFPNFLVTGKPYTSKPLNFKGWFKYLPVNGDSAGIAVQLFRWTPTGRELIAIADTVIYDSVPGWISFNRPFNYLVPGATPDTIEVVAVSSYGGESFLGEVGSTLYVDDLEVSGLFVSSEDPEVKARMEVWPVPARDELMIRLPDDEVGVSTELMSLQGKLLRRWEGVPTRLDVSGMPAGSYVLQVGTRSGGTFTRNIQLMP